MLPTLKTVLQAMDLSEHSPDVFLYALSLARSYDAELVLVHATEPLSPFAESLVKLYVDRETDNAHHEEIRLHALEELRKRIQEICEEAVSSVPGEECRVADIRVREGRPAEVVLREADTTNADVIVMGSHGHTAVGELLLGTTAHQVIQRAGIPVFLVRAPKV